MRLRLGTPSTVLVVAPHPDDEVIGCFGLMRRLRAAGSRVRVLIAADGAASHPSSAAWPRARLVRERRRESLRALRRLGIPASSVAFLALPDGRLASARREIGRAIARYRAIQLIVGPERTDDHADHRAVARAMDDARMPGARRLAYPVWPITRSIRTYAGVPLAPGVRLAKRSTLRGYRTQTGAIRDDPAGFTMSPQQIAAFCGGRERFREQRR